MNDFGPSFPYCLGRGLNSEGEQVVEAVRRYYPEVSFLEVTDSVCQNRVVFALPAPGVRWAGNQSINEKMPDVPFGTPRGSFPSCRRPDRTGG